MVQLVGDVSRLGMRPSVKNTIWELDEVMKLLSHSQLTTRSASPILHHLRAPRVQMLNGVRRAKSCIQACPHSTVDVNIIRVKIQKEKVPTQSKPHRAFIQLLLFLTASSKTNQGLTKFFV